MSQLEIVWVNDERVDISLSGVPVISVNHDEQGWDGMTAAIDTAKKMAELLHIPIITDGTPNL